MEGKFRQRKVTVIQSGLFVADTLGKEDTESKIQPTWSGKHLC